jgi:hypothetical protein
LVIFSPDTGSADSVLMHPGFRLFAMMLVCASPVMAQSAVDTVPREMWSIDGKVQLCKRAGPLPVKNSWVTVHRISSDPTGRVSGGALDSVMTDAGGRYRIRFPHFGESEATYIAVTTYEGVSYISAPMTRPSTTGDDALIMVFDTIAPPYPIRVAGRHYVLTSPDTADRRRVVEVYELSNDSTYTVIGTEENPVWKAALPADVTDLQLNPQGDITTGTAKQDGAWLKVFAPISPGIRQVSFTYTLPANAFPLSMPIVDSASVFELLVQEQDAVIDGGGFTEVAGVMQNGLPFRRLLAQNVPQRAVVRFEVPRPTSRFVRGGVRYVAAIVGAVMLFALAFVIWSRRRVRAITTETPKPDATESLIRELAMLDAEFERRKNPTDAEKADFATRRAALKAQLAEKLAPAAGRT